MKKQILTLSLGLMSVLVFGQKKQLKTAEKAIDNKEFTTALNAISSVDGMLADMDEKYKSKYYFLKGQALAGKNNYEAAAEAFNNLFNYEKEIGKQRYTNDAQPMLNTLIQKVSNLGADLYNKDKNYKEAAKNFALTYKLSPTDTSFLYNAAVSASLAKDYEASLEYYQKLRDLGYTGISKTYFAVDKETGEKVNVGSLNNQKTYVKLGTHQSPTVELSESKQADIIKNMGYILIAQGKTDEAIVAIKEARKSNPKDLNLLLNEAQLYIKLEQMDKFGALMQEAIKLDPNNATLFFNLGVVNQNEGRTEEAIKYYERAVELDPDYGDAYMNLAVAILSGERAIVDEMNENLSNAKKYEELEKKQKALYRKALPYLEKADNIKRTLDTVKSLLNIYGILRMTEKEDKIRPVYKKMLKGM